MSQAKQRILEINARIDAEHMRPMFTMTIDVPVSPERVKEILFSVDGAPESNQSMLLVGRPNRQLEIQNDDDYLTITMNGEHPYIAHGWIDRANSRLVAQGHWWYRGEYAVEPSGNGGVVTYRVYNIAPQANRWMVPLMQWNFRATMQLQLDALQRQCTDGSLSSSSN